MSLKFICAQPANKYYTWQVEVVINNFVKNGVNPNDIDILCSIGDETPQEWLLLETHYSDVRFSFYKDTRESRRYIPAIYFHLMKKHFQRYPELENEVLFTFDSDTIFTKPVDFSAMERGNVWYLSDTTSYINYDYIMQKGNAIYEGMCDIVGIDKLIPQLMNSNSGGAQYIVKDTTYDFWDKVESDSVELYEFFCKKEPDHVQKYENDYPIQKWTAGMWSYLWNAWLCGHETKVDSRLDFTWATSPKSEWTNNSIYHNAGILDTQRDTYFFKGDYANKLPYGIKNTFSEDLATHYYVNEIIETAKVSCLL